MRRDRATWSRLAVVIAAIAVICAARPVLAEDTSQPAILQVFEARWDTIEDRMADVFQVGYGRMWTPPVSKAGSPYSVGYDVFDRFDLGGPGNETHFGTSNQFKAMVGSAHAAGVMVNPDLIWNHNGLGNRTDAYFVELGGYPGFALTLASDIDGDFHDPAIGDAISGDQINGQLAGLNDIAQEKNHQFIRHPIEAGNPDNIPAGTTYNLPDSGNTRFYPDMDLGGTTVWHPQLGQYVTLYDFNSADPSAGDPVMENATGLLMRNARWMIQEYDIDGFRLDAARHYPRWVLNYFDQATFLAKKTPLLDGSPQHVYSFIETGGDSASFIQDFIRMDVDTVSSGTLGGNRDVLDFNLFYALRNNLSADGTSNNWHNIRYASIDMNDDGYRNGSQGVSFVQSHDEVGPALENVAYAYTLLRPGQALVYLNAEEYGPTGDFPKAGKDDALGGYYGETITRLVEIRNSHGRGDFHERWIDDAFNPDGFSNVYIYERSKSVIVGLNSRNDTVVETRSGVQTNFAAGTILVELTGNATDPTVDPGGVIPDSIKVNASGQVNVSIPANTGHGRGYVIYGLATPEGTLSLSNVASTIPGQTQTSTTFGTARLADIDVITANSFTATLATTPVSVPDPDYPGQYVRDEHADGDYALIKLDGGLDINTNAGVDHVTPNSVDYGFEEFTTTNLPGYIAGGGGTGSGQYEQAIDTTALAEGRHYITVRAFRHRDDGGPAVFTDFKRTIYVDRLPPEAEIVSFDPVNSNPNNRDMVVRSVDQTADGMHIFLDLPAAMTDAEVYARALLGYNTASDYDRDSFILGFSSLATGNHVATVVTFEPSGNYNVQRFAGQFTDTNKGAGFGDADADGVFEITDIRGTNNRSVEDIIYSQNAKFNAAVDVNGDGLGDDRDLFALGDELVIAGAGQTVLDSYVELLLDRGDVDDSDTTDVADVVALYTNFGSTDWLYDLNVDGVTDTADVETMVTEVFRSAMGDFDLNGAVDGDDFLLWQRGVVDGTLYTDGDADLDGDVDLDDLSIWRNAFGFTRTPLQAIESGGGALSSVPEPSSAVLVGVWLTAAAVALRKKQTVRRGSCGRPSYVGVTNTKQLAS